MTQILCFGDSIVWGAWDIEGGWVNRLRRYFDEKTTSQTEFWNTDFTQVYNLGISSNTLTDLLKRFKQETEARLLEEDKDVIFIFEIGANDSSLLNSLPKTEKRTTIYEFDENLVKLINEAEEYSKNIIFIGTAMVDEPRTTPVPWDSNRFYRNKYLEHYNNIIKGNCIDFKRGDSTLNIYYLDLFKRFSEFVDYRILLADGLHPNTEGHKAIFEVVKSYFIDKEQLDVAFGDGVWE